MKCETIVADKYREIRKQAVLGTNCIKTHGKSLYFSTWIKENIVLVNDVIDDKWENQVLKLKKIQNWIGELCTRKALCKSWKKI